MTALTPAQRERYERNLLIPSFGEEGQVRLGEARVLIVGLGGLGSPVALYLAAAGVGTLGLMDSDEIELSNLQRQILHTTERVGHTKCASAKATLSALDPSLGLCGIHERLTEGNAADIIGQYDVVVEACDNFEAKYLINDTCVSLGKPFATAGILALSGQALFVVPGQTACLRCLAPDMPEDVPTTSELGVLGAVPGILGSLEAMEVVRYLVGMWTPQPNAAGLLHSIDGETMRLKTLRVPQRSRCTCASQYT